MLLDDTVVLPYRVGALMYTPALTKGVAQKLKTNAYPGLTSMALCLEDSIADAALEEAEAQLCATLDEIARETTGAQRPLLFVRIRTPEHMARIHAMLGASAGLLTGYVLPKFDLSNAQGYISVLQRINAGAERPWCIMPTLESSMVADAGGRVAQLQAIREALEPIRPWVINIRVGGNDFCNLFGLRRAVHHTIYDVGPVRDILVDILNVFAREYVVSGPVWEYFGADEVGAWATGLQRELELDLLNGFVGKTAIHPSQLPVINRGLQVSRADYEDALRILDWDGGGLGVNRGANGRMNEVKCHARWAKGIVARKIVYGLKEDA
ncbi:MAG: HpcH/HpaI aldolase/citrate lyase family protein [Clostridia bacterium]|nr:HpcH/HpaI aldolase/citrate lyase family protein [Clostridia bacterium]